MVFPIFQFQCHCLPYIYKLAHFEDPQLQRPNCKWLPPHQAQQNQWTGTSTHRTTRGKVRLWLYSHKTKGMAHSTDCPNSKVFILDLHSTVSTNDDNTVIQTFGLMEPTEAQMSTGAASWD